MGKHNGCKFSQGIVLGLIGGFLAGYFFKENSHHLLPEKTDEDGHDQSSNKKESKEKTEELIGKTLDAIDKGFDKINTMISDIKNKEEDDKK